MHTVNKNNQLTSSPTTYQKQGFNRFVVISLAVLLVIVVIASLWKNHDYKVILQDLGSQQAAISADSMKGVLAASDQKGKAIQLQLNSLASRVTNLAQTTKDSNTSPTTGATGPIGPQGVPGQNGTNGTNGTASCPNGGCISLQTATPAAQETGNISVSGTVTAGNFSGSGASLISLNGSNISSGTVADARLSANVTVQGNTFNGASQLVQTTVGGALPTLSGANLILLNASNVSSGTLSDSRLSANAALLNGTGPQTFTGNNKFTGTFLQQNASDSTIAFQVQNALGTSLLVVDTTNLTISLGLSSATPILLVLGNKNTSGDPAGTVGATYYNSNSGKFRCYENGDWHDCSGGTLGSGYAQVTSQQSGITTEVDLTGLSVTVTAPANHRLRVIGYGAFKSTLVSSCSLYIKESSTYIGRAVAALSITSTDSTVQAAAIITPSSGSHTYKLSASCSNSSTLNAGAASATANPAYILAEDIGQ